jgi:Tfp pilus assembly protein PilX
MSARGFVLLPVLAFILVIALIAYGATRGGPAAVAQLAQSEDAAAARYAAEAGLAHAAWAASQSDCGNYQDLDKEPFGGATYDVEYSARNGSPVTVTATGQLVGGASWSLARTIDVYQLPVTIENQPDEQAADTFIESSATTTANPVAKKLEAWKQASKETRALLTVDLSTVPSGSEVVSAVLEIKVENVHVLASGAEITAHRLTRAWNEANASWANYDILLVLGQPWTTAGGDYDAEPAARLAVDGTKGWKSLDLTTLVQDWLAGRLPPYGVLLKANSNLDDFKFFSSDQTNAADRPKLVVQYVCRCGATCARPVANGTTIALSTLNDGSIAGFSFEDGDVVNYDPAKAQAAPALLENDVFAAVDEDIDAFHIRDDGTVVLSTETAANIAGLAAQDEDVVDYDPKAGTAALLFDGSARFAADEDVDAVYPYGDGRLVLSTQTAASLAGTAFDADDLVDYDPTSNTATLVFDGGAHFAAAENIDAVQMLDDGRFLLSTDSDATLGGLTFTDADVVLYDPLEDRAAKVYDGTTLTSTPDADVDGIQDFRPHPLVDELRLEPVADTFLASASPGTAFGGSATLTVGNNARSMLKFDLAALPVGATVTSATLWLNLASSGGLSLVTGAYKVTATWAEGTATWSNTGNGGTFDALPVATATFTAAVARWVGWSLPVGLIQEWRDGVTPNYGVLLKPTAIALGPVSARSRNHTSSAVHPRLVIKYSLP